MRKGFYVYHNRKSRRGMMRKDESGHAAGGQAGSGGADNQGGNSGTSTNTTESQNNSGQGFDGSTFWSDPAQGSSGSPSGGSAESGESSGGAQGSEHQQLGQTLATRIGSLSFNPAFTADIATQIGEGNLDGINESLTQMHRQSIQESLTMSAQIMQMYGQHLMTQVEQMIQQSFGNRDDQSALESEFPTAAANPAIRPMIAQVFSQSMKHTGGNRAKAISMTRDMLALMSQSVGTELGISQPPGSLGDMTQGANDLVAELIGRN